MGNVFVSHDSEDNAQTRTVVAALEARGHVVFVDFDPRHGIIPGEEWQRRLLEELQLCDALVYLNSRAALESDWCRLEVALALQRERVVITLDLEPDLERHPLLPTYQAILQRGALESGIERLLDALDRLGIKPTPGGRWNPDRSPYPGLRSFGADDAGMYFGREDDVDDVVGLLRSTAAGQGVVAVVGASGVGKSSMLRAGVIPRIATQDEPWVIVGPFEPQAHPADRLLGCLRSLCEEHGLDPPGIDAPPEELPRLVDSLAMRAGSDRGRLLVAVDSLEQLLTASTPNQRDRFLRMLGALSKRGVPVSLLLAIRLDQSEALQRMSPLGDLMRKPLFIAPLSRDRLDDVIEQPAKRAGLKLEPELAERIAQDAASGRDQDGVLSLPLVAFTLQRMWERMHAAERRELRHEDYDAVGRIDGAIAQAADQAEAGARPEDQERLDRLLTRFVTISEQQTLVGRPVPLEQLSPEERVLAATLENERLLSGDQDHVQLTHDRLLSAWPRLKRLTEERREDLLVRSRLERQAAEWRATASEVLTEPRTAQASAWLAEHRSEVTEDVVHLVDASSRHWRRRRQRRLAAIGAGVVLVLVAASLAVVAVRQARREDAAARTRRSEQLAGQAIAQLSGDPAVAGHLALAAQTIEATPIARRAMASAVDALTRRTAPDATKTVGPALTAVAVGRGGLIAAGGLDGSVHSWSSGLGDDQPLRPPGGPPVTALAASRDGRYLATGDEDGMVTVWNLGTRRPVHDGLDVSAAGLAPSSDLSILSLAWSPDGTALAAATGAGDLVRWAGPSDRARPEPARVRLPPEGEASAVGYRKDGSLLAGLADGRVLTVDGGPTPAAGSAEEEEPVHRLGVTAIAEDRSGVMATAGGDGTIAIWSPGAGRPSLVIPAGLRVASVALLADGTAVAAALIDGSVRIWDSTSGTAAHTPVRGHVGQAAGLAVDPDQDRLVSVGDDGRLRVWTVDERILPRAPELDEETDDLTGPLAVRDDGLAALVDDQSGAVVLRDQGASRAAARLTVPGGREAVVDLVFVDEGSAVVGSGETGSIWRWPVPAAVGQGRDVEPQRTTKSWLSGRSKAEAKPAGAAPAALASDAEGRWLATTDANGEVRLRDPRTLAAVGGPLGGDGSHATHVSIAADGSVVAAGDESGEVRAWRRSDGRQLMEVEAARDELLAVVVSPDGDIVATSAADELLVRIWSADAGGEAQAAFDVRAPVTTLAFAADGRTLVAGDASGAVSAWDLGTGRLAQDPVAAHVDSVVDLALDPSRSEVVSAGLDAQLPRTPCPACLTDVGLAARLRDLLQGERGLTEAERVLYGVGS